MLAIARHTATEMDVGQYRDAGLVQQAPAERLRIRAAGQLAGFGHVGPGVERPAGRRAGDARHVVEQPHDEVAAFEEARAHGVGGVLGPGDRGDRRPLRDLRRAGLGVGDPAREDRRQRAVGHVTDAPSGHRPCLGRAVADDRALQHARARRERIEAPVVHQPRIDLVGEDPHLRMAREDLRDGVEILAVEDAAGRVLRRVEYQQPRVRRDPRLEFGRVEGESARLAQVDRHRHGAVGVDLRFVDREPGHRVDHLVADAVVGHRRDRVGDERLGARADDDVVRTDVEAAPRPRSCAAAARNSSMPALGV